MKSKLLALAVLAASATAGCGNNAAESETDAGQNSAEIDELTKEAARAGERAERAAANVGNPDAVPLPYESSNNASTGSQDAEQAERYERLSEDGQEYVDQRMKEYDDICATSADC